MDELKKGLTWEQVPISTVQDQEWVEYQNLLAKGYTFRHLPQSTRVLVLRGLEAAMENLRAIERKIINEQGDTND